MNIKGRNLIRNFLVTFCVIIGGLSPARGVLIIDIDTSSHAFNFSENPDWPVAVNHSIQVISFDTKDLEIKSIHHFMVPSGRGVYSFKLDSCHIDYSLEEEKPVLTISPIENYKAIYRSWGKFKTIHKIHSLEEWDLTRPTWSVVCQDILPQVEFSQLCQHLNGFTPPTTTHWKKGHKKPFQLEAHYKEKILKLLIDPKQKGDIGERVCDITMMAGGCIKLNAKHTGNQGIDGLYQKGDHLFATEVKFYNDPEPLDAIVRDYLFPKFNMDQKGAIMKVDALLREKIRRSNFEKKLYFLPYGVYPDGKAYCYVKLQSFSDPSYSDLWSPQPSPKGKEKAFSSPCLETLPAYPELEKALVHYRKTNSLTMEELRFHLFQICQNIEQEEMLLKTSPLPSEKETLLLAVESPSTPLKKQLEKLSLGETPEKEKSFSYSATPVKNLLVPRTADPAAYKEFLENLRGKRKTDKFEEELARIVAIRKTPLKKIRQGYGQEYDEELKQLHEKCKEETVQKKLEEFLS